MHALGSDGALRTANNANLGLDHTYGAACHLLSLPGTMFRLVQYQEMNNHPIGH